MNFKGQMRAAFLASSPKEVEEWLLKPLTAVLGDAAMAKKAIAAIALMAVNAPVCSCCGREIAETAQDHRCELS